MLRNLDVLDPLEPSAVLGGEDPSKKVTKGGKKKAKKVLKEGSHQDAVHYGNAHIQSQILFFYNTFPRTFLIKMF